MNKIWTTLLKPRAWVAKLLLVIFVVAFFSLGFLDYLQPIKEFLDSDVLAFKVGDMRFSVYLLTKAIIAIVILFWVASIFAEFGEKKIKNLRKVKASNRALITKAFQIIVYFVAFLVALDTLGIDLTALAVVGGAIGIGIGFGLQKITSNFISGLIR
jgi:small-conductance mechanosensitive channel